MPRRNIRFSHVGFHVRDLDAMVAFYTKHLGLHVTDRGALHALPGEPGICFLSADPTEHHQIALVEGRGDAKSTLQQVSFHVDALQDLRDLDAELGEAGVAVKFGLNHGNAWSLYFADPEGNLVECFVESPWYTRQPVTDPLDLSMSDDEILARTKEVYESDPDFQPVEAWRAAFAMRLEEG